jgi:arabinan endo-1,5-alpha-L-arabinosidase
MVKQGSTYYVYYTGGRIQYKTSSDRIIWTNRGELFPTTASWIKNEVPANNNDFWAPDIFYKNNRYYLYYSVSSFGKNLSAIGLATSPTLDPSASDYKWTDQGMVIKSVNSNNYNCIDPNVFQDTDGSFWLTYGSWWSGIKLVRLDPMTGKLQSSPPAIISIAARTSTSLGIEAPFIVRRNNYYYLFVSWDVCCDGVSSTYKIVVGRASKVDGPYVDKSGKTMTTGGGTILDQGDSRWKGPGHNGIFIENDTVFCINHAYDALSNGSATMMIRPLFWVDDWPAFSKPVVTNNLLSIQNSKVEKTEMPQLILHASGSLSKMARRKNYSFFSITGLKLKKTDESKTTGLIIMKPQ